MVLNISSETNGLIEVIYMENPYGTGADPGASFINKVPRTNQKSVLGYFLGYV